jgi:hypothetical protein
MAGNCTFCGLRVWAHNADRSLGHRAVCGYGSAVCGLAVGMASEAERVIVCREWWVCGHRWVELCAAEDFAGVYAAAGDAAECAAAEDAAGEAGGGADAGYEAAEHAVGAAAEGAGFEEADCEAAEAAAADVRNAAAVVLPLHCCQGQGSREVQGRDRKNFLGPRSAYSRIVVTAAGAIGEAKTS